MRSDNLSMNVKEPSQRTLDLLLALQFRGVGVAAVRKIAQVMARRPAATLEDMVDDRTIPFISSLRSADGEFAKEKVGKIVEACFSRSITLLSPLDKEYPPHLGDIRDYPPLLYVRGNLAALNGDAFAVVGTRHASDVGLEIARRISKALASKNVSVVSGLALGIDTAAHKGALEATGTTVAVLAHGLDIVAPASNQKLAEQILECRGALISEHEPGVPPRPAEFVRRNRIQSGMSLCSVIVESGAAGGAIHQARFTHEQGRLVVVAFPDFDGRPSMGFNYEGARFLRSELDAIPIAKAEELDGIIEKAKDKREKSYHQFFGQNAN